MKNYTFETRFFPMVKNSWGWEELEFTNFILFTDLSIGFEQNKILFEEIKEFFKVY